MKISNEQLTCRQNLLNSLSKFNIGVSNENKMEGPEATYIMLETKRFEFFIHNDTLEMYIRDTERSLIHLEIYDFENYEKMADEFIKRVSTQFNK